MGSSNLYTSYVFHLRGIFVSVFHEMFLHLNTDDVYKACCSPVQCTWDTNCILKASLSHIWEWDGCIRHWIDAVTMDRCLAAISCFVARFENRPLRNIYQLMHCSIAYVYDCVMRQYKMGRETGHYRIFYSAVSCIWPRDRAHASEK